MSALSTIRHDEVFNAREHNQQITIIGAGATGSRLFAALVELGLSNITVIDFDQVEPHNLANQLFTSDDIGSLKVEALAKWACQKLGLRELPDTFRFINGRVPDPEIPVQGTVFLLTDTMSSRKQIFEEVLQFNPEIYRVIETRMASSYGNIFTFNPNDPEKAQAWVDTLTSDEETEVSACGSSISVGTTASIIANLAAWQYMLRKKDPAGADDVVDIFLHPFCTSTRAL